jgi:hypothetical protein
MFAIKDLKSSNKVILDSGALVSMLNNRTHFDSIVKKSIVLYLANGQKIEAKGYGDATIMTSSGPLCLGSCIFAPKLLSSLVAMAPLICMKMAIVPSNSLKYQVVNNDGTLSFEGTYNKGLLVIPGLKHIASSITASPLLLRNRLGNPNNEFLKIAFPGVPFTTINCVTCLLLKSSRLPFNGKFPEPNYVLEMVHMDLCGPISPQTPSKLKYFLVVIDGKSRF